MSCFTFGTITKVAVKIRNWKGWRKVVDNRGIERPCRAGCGRGTAEFGQTRNPTTSVARVSSSIPRQLSQNACPRSRALR